MPEDIVKDTVFDVANRVAVAMESAVKEHGAAAVDLALTAYRIDAAHHLLTGVLLLVPVSFALFWFFPWVWRTVEKWDGEYDDPFGTRMFAVVLGGSLIVFLTAISLSKLLNIYYWAAALGYPELMIAKKALEAGGLL